MNEITRRDLQDLLQEAGKHQVSLYMPTYQTGRELQENPIRFKNLLSDIAGQLQARGLNPMEIDRLLQPAQNLFNDMYFSQHLSSGLALLISERRAYTYRLPLHFKEYARVSDHFYLKPLLPMFSGDGQFYLLALSQNQIRLLKGTRDTVDEIDLEDMPGSLNEALRVDNFQTYLQWHTRTTQTAGRRDRDAVYHGHGPGKDDAEADLLNFFHIIDAEIQKHLEDGQAPLILAGVEYLLPLYRQANEYPRLVEKSIAGNPEELSLAELHRRAWELIAPFFERERKEAGDRYKALAGKGESTASDDIDAISRAAYNARVAVLFVNLDVSEWGRFNPDSGEVIHLNPEEPSARDLLDFAAGHTILNSGVVYAVPTGQMPAESPAAAIFRY